MDGCFFSLPQLPDLTLSKYSAEESGGISDVIRQHHIFYRQLNRKALLFCEVYHLIFLYRPENPPGCRLEIYFRADCANGQQPVNIQEFMTASPLSAYFHFEKRQPTWNPEFPWEVELSKQDGFVSSSLIDSQNQFYMVNAWKPNENARLMGLFRMMKTLNQPCAYSVGFYAVERSEIMRSGFRTQMQYIRNSSRVSQGQRDENADQVLRSYDKFLESLRTSPHFRCRIRAYGRNVETAKMLLDAAASEAVEEGNYTICQRQGRFQPLNPGMKPVELCSDNTPRGMREWNSLFLLKEAVPFAMLPTLYPAETIELPKESAPVYENNGLHLGKDTNGYDVYVPLEYLPKHALLAGVPGSGKTFSMLHIASQLSGVFHIPILVLEPAKKEYRALACNDKMKDLIVFSPGSTGAFPLRINPFQFPVGMKLSEHITRLRQVFEGAFDLTPPMPELIDRGIEAVYRNHGWFPFEVNSGEREYPSMTELYGKLAELLDASDYAQEVKSNLKSCLQVRIGSLIKREMGNVFDVPTSTLSPEEWMEWHCVLELESLGSDAANFLTLLLSTIVREMLRQKPYTGKAMPRHIIFFEEAHNLIGPTTVASTENGDAKVASTKFIVDMLAEVRALHEAIIIADQLPTALASQVTKNTSLKLGHKITAVDDREMLASTMSADGVQLERMATFSPGQALCIYDKVQKPFEIKVMTYEGDSESPDNEELYSILSKRESYQTAMRRDFQIMQIKYKKRNLRMMAEYERLIRFRNTVNENLNKLSNLDQSSSGYREKEKQMLAQVERLETDISTLCGNWTELALEVSDYVHMNRLMFTEGRAWAVGELISCLTTIDDIGRECVKVVKPWAERLKMELLRFRDATL